MEETKSLEDAFRRACDEVGVKVTDQVIMGSLMGPLRNNSDVTHVHYLHSLRVALKVRQIARFQHMEEKPLVFAGALHDIGKAQVPPEVLGKTGDWTAHDQTLTQRHAMDGYRLLQGRFYFTADIMIWHHQFQVNAYPKKMPKPLHPYSTATRLVIAESGRMLALADVYDALHRPNGKFGKTLNREEVRAKMLEFNPDRALLVRALYAAGIFG